MKKSISIFTVSMQGGGAERVISLLLDKLHDEYDIHLVLLEAVFDFNIPQTVKVKILSPLTNGKSFLNILLIPILAIQLWHYNKKNQISTCISFLNRPNWINSFSKLWSSRYKVVISERTTSSVYYDNLGFSGRIGKILIKYLYPLADTIIPNSEGVKFDLEHKFNIKGNYRIIYNSVEIGQMDNDKSVKNKKGFTYVFVARFQLPKDHITLIKAFEIVVRSHNATLILYGVGEKQNECIKLAEDLGISQHVQFLGFDNDIHKYLNKSDCFVFSSFCEGFPNVILEAMAAGLPVIATDCPSGPREIISPNSSYNYQIKGAIEYGEHGILVPVGDIHLLAEAMEKVLIDNEYRYQLSKTSFIRAKQFSVEKFINCFKEIV